ncbi:MAG: hypothetical protein HYR60_15025 [Acidobacteria bacterium]|nr:hypothetical protein [Acidobacteriota bacterium]
MTSGSARAELVTSLSAMVCATHKRAARRFLQGLSSDELRYIAEFMGSCLLEGEHPCLCSRTQLAEAIQRFDGTRPGGNGDRAHKMVLLFEYLCRSAPEPVAVAVRAARR